jgi:hypothetical protein
VAWSAAAGGVQPWAVKYLEWVKRDVHFAVKAQEATLLDYLHEVEHMAARIVRLDDAIEEAVKVAPAKMRAVIEGLQALRGIAQISAVTIVAELGEVTRFSQARELMGQKSAARCAYEKNDNRKLLSFSKSWMSLPGNARESNIGYVTNTKLIAHHQRGWVTLNDYKDFGWPSLSVLKAWVRSPL